MTGLNRSGGASAIRVLRTVMVVVPLLLLSWAGWLATRGARVSPQRAGPPVAAFIPDVRFRDAYLIETEASPEELWQMVRSVDWTEAPMVAPAMFLRELPLRLGLDRARQRSSVVTLDTLVGMGAFVVLREVPGEVIVLGSVGRVWRADYGSLAVPADSFVSFRIPGFVRIAWSIETQPRLGGGSRLLMEWRSAPTDPRAERRFRAYWAVAGPVVRVLARSALPWIRDRAEAAAFADTVQEPADGG
jgi:hypothetical protein